MNILKNTIIFYKPKFENLVQSYFFKNEKNIENTLLSFFISVFKLK